MTNHESIREYQEKQAKLAAYERTLQRGFEDAAQQIRPAAPPHTVQGRLMALEEALHRLINIADDLERLSAPFRTSPGVLPSRKHDETRPVMAEVAEQVDRAADNINTIADRLMSMADGFK